MSDVRSAAKSALADLQAGTVKNTSDEAPASTPEPQAAESAPEKTEAAAPTPSNEESAAGAEGAEASTPGSEPDAGENVTPSSDSVASAPEVDLPFGWNDVKDHWKDIPAAVQQKIVTRAQQANRLVHEATERAAARERELTTKYAGMDDIFDPQTKTKLRLNNIPEAAALKNLANCHSHLENAETRHAALRFLCDSYGVKPEELLGVPQQVDPQYSALEAQIQNLRQTIEQQQNAVQQSQSQSLEGEIMAFAQETNPDGSPARPYFASVYPAMLPIARRLHAEHPDQPLRAILGQAYREVVEPIVGSERRALEAKRQAEAKERADKAKVAGKSISSSAGGGSVPVVPKSIREIAASVQRGELR